MTSILLPLRIRRWWTVFLPLWVSLKIIFSSYAMTNLEESHFAIWSAVQVWRNISFKLLWANAQVCACRIHSLDVSDAVVEIMSTMNLRKSSAQGRNEGGAISQAPNDCGGRRKVPPMSQVLSTTQYICFPKVLRFGAKLASCPGRHLISLRTWFGLTSHTSNRLQDAMQWLCQSSDYHRLQFRFFGVIQLVAILDGNVVKASFLQFNNDFAGLGAEDGTLLKYAFKNFSQCFCKLG